MLAEGEKIAVRPGGGYYHPGPVGQHGDLRSPGYVGEFDSSNELILLHLAFITADFCISSFERATLVFQAGVWSSSSQNSSPSGSSVGPVIFALARKYFVKSRPGLRETHPTTEFSLLQLCTLFLDTIYRDLASSSQVSLCCYLLG